MDKYKETVVNVQSGEKTVIERDFTAEEIAAREAATEQPTTEQPAEPTTEERLANLEEALNMILNGVTE